MLPLKSGVACERTLLVQVLDAVVLQWIQKVKIFKGRSELKQQLPSLFPPRMEQMCSQPQLVPDVDRGPSAWAVAVCVCLCVCMCVFSHWKLQHTCVKVSNVTVSADLLLTPTSSIPPSVRIIVAPDCLQVIYRRKSSLTLNLPEHGLACVRTLSASCHNSAFKNES